MNTAAAPFDWLRRLVIRYGAVRGTLICSFLSIIASLIITTFFMTFFSNGLKPIDVVVAIVVPGVVATVFSYMQLTVLYELEQAREAVRALAITDALTNAFNWRHFKEIALREFERARRHSKPLSLILLDVDGFKEINDAFGHLSGDHVLQAISAACKSTIRSHDIFARYGGDEFILLLPETDTDLAVAAAERIRQLITALRPENSGREFRATISLGVTTSQRETRELNDLLVRADQALYEAKASGKNCVRAA